MDYDFIQKNFNIDRRLHETEQFLWKNIYRRDGESKLTARDIPLDDENFNPDGAVAFRNTITIISAAGTGNSVIYHAVGAFDADIHIIGYRVYNATKLKSAVITEYDSVTRKISLKTPIAGQVAGQTIRIYQDVDNVQKAIEALDKHEFINHTDTPEFYSSGGVDNALKMIRVNIIPDGLEFKYGEDCLEHNLIHGLQGGVPNYPVGGEIADLTEYATLLVGTEMYHLTSGEHGAMTGGPDSDASSYHTHGNLAKEYFQLPAGEVLPAYKIVISDGTDAYLADNTILANANALVGITLHSAAIGATVNIKENGVVENGTWSWTPGSILYLSTAGDMTHTPPATGFCMEVGIPITATKVNFNPQMSIELA